MWDFFIDSFGYAVFLYTMCLLFSYGYLIISSAKAQKIEKLETPDPTVIKQMLKNAPFLPGVSVIAPAYNEEKTIIDNVNSLLSIDYPKYEVIIVNDGSSDHTMELLIKTFELKKAAFVYHEYVSSKPVKAILKSTNPKYSKLIVVDKERAGFKCDGSNAGINVSSFPYFVCTDVDCIVNPLALYRMMWPVITHHNKVIGVSATMLISNGCKVENGKLIEAKVPKSPIPLFQTLEYMRSFLISKLGWSRTNLLPNISGGFGFYDKEIVIQAGGYAKESLAEDMDMLLKSMEYLGETHQKYRLIQVPDVLCWTEGPSTIKSLYRQRIRWSKGLCQIMKRYMRLSFKKRYHGIGMFMMPYMFLFEFLAPIIEAIGVVSLITLVATDSINWDTFWLIALLIYVAAQFVTIVVIMFDFTLSSAKWNNQKAGYPRLFIASLLEPIFYHPIITFCSVVGYIQYLFKINMGWGVMQRKGFATKENEIKNSPLSPKGI